MKNPLFSLFPIEKSMFMPPTLKKLMGHIAFGACMGGCVGGWVTLFVATVTFKPLKLVLKFHLWIPHKNS